MGRSNALKRVALGNGDEASDIDHFRLAPRKMGSVGRRRYCRALGRSLAGQTGRRSIAGDDSTPDSSALSGNAGDVSIHFPRQCAGFQGSAYPRHAIDGRPEYNGNVHSDAARGSVAIKPAIKPLRLVSLLLGGTFFRLRSVAPAAIAPPAPAAVIPKPACRGRSRSGW